MTNSQSNCINIYLPKVATPLLAQHYSMGIDYEIIEK